jgi:hypothetical protein
MHEENRREGRRKVLKAATITCHQLRTSTDCMVRNLSDAGACLSVVSHRDIPDDFSLVLGRSISHCHAEWRRQNQIGVSFSTRG